MITRRAIVQGLACATLLGGSGIARAQAFPDKVVKIIVPLPPGSPPDVLARVVGEGLSKLWKQPVVVENRPGGTGSVGMQALVRSPADGYTVGIMFLTHTVIPELMGPLSYNTATDIEPIGNAVWLYNVLTVPAASPIRSLQDLVDRARAQPGALTYGSGGNGSPAHLVAESFCQATQTKMLHVPFRGPAEAVTALIGDQLSTMFATVSTAAPLIKAERLRALAVTSPERMSAMPNVPTLKEAGVSGLELKEVGRLRGTGGHTQGAHRQVEPGCLSSAGAARGSQPPGRTGHDGGRAQPARGVRRPGSQGAGALGWLRSLPWSETVLSTGGHRAACRDLHGTAQRNRPARRPAAGFRRPTRSAARRSRRRRVPSR
jgi:tripartite-type tricarboxylate transporter receptor subunit TctC